MLVGAMVSSNTETGVAVTYEDGDGTLDFVLATAQPNITSLGTLTTLTVDDITINGSVISDGGALDITSGADMLLDSEGDIIFDANGANFKFKDDNTPIFELNNSSSDLEIFVNTADKDIKFGGNDGGSTITAMTIDMSAAGSVGIGQTSPSAKLDVVTDSVVYAAQFTNSKTTNGDGVKVQIGSAAASEYAFDVRSNAGSTQIISAKGDGNVAIGTSTPTTQFTVTKSANIAQVAITSSSAAVAWDATAAANAYHVTTENTTFSAPSNAVEGAIIQVEIAQGGTARTIAWNTVFEFAASTAPTVTATANKTDIFTFRYNGSVWQEIGRVQNLAQT